MSAFAILSFLNVDIDKKTLQRDLKDLEKKFLIFKKGSGRNTIYSLTSCYEILKKVDVEKYFLNSSHAALSFSLHFGITRNITRCLANKRYISK